METTETRAPHVPPRPTATERSDARTAREHWLGYVARLQEIVDRRESWPDAYRGALLDAAEDVLEQAEEQDDNTDTARYRIYLCGKVAGLIQALRAVPSGDGGYQTTAAALEDRLAACRIAAPVQDRSDEQGLIYDLLDNLDRLARLHPDQLGALIDIALRNRRHVSLFSEDPHPDPLVAVLRSLAQASGWRHQEEVSDGG